MPRARRALDVLSLAALVLVDFAVLQGSALVVAFAVEAVALHMLGRRLSDDVARLGALVLLALAAGKALDVARPVSLAARLSPPDRGGDRAGRRRGGGDPPRCHRSPPSASCTWPSMIRHAVRRRPAWPGPGPSVCWSARGLAVLWLGLLRRDARALRFTGFSACPRWRSARCSSTTSPRPRRCTACSPASRSGSCSSPRPTPTSGSVRRKPGRPRRRSMSLRDETTTDSSRRRSARARGDPRGLRYRGP